MKILNVNHLLDPKTGGGTAERTVQLTRSLNAEGVHSEILALAIGDISELENELPNVHWIPCINHRFFIPGIRPGNVAKLISEFDVIHLMGHWTILNAMVAIICLLQGKPYVVCPAGALKNFGRSRILKWVYDCLIGKRIIRSANGWVAITHDEKADFVNYDILPESVEIIPNGVDPESYQIKVDDNNQPGLMERLSINGQPYILFLGRLNEIKGPDLLLEAFTAVAKKFPAMHLMFAGPDAGLQGALKVNATMNGIAERVHFAGFVTGREKSDALRNAKCLVIPSREEAMSIVVLEAGICGTPVIFTDRCGLEEFVCNDAGIEVEAEADSIRRGLEQALSSPGKLHESSRRLKKMVQERFLWRSQAKLYTAMYRQIIEVGK